MSNKAELRNKLNDEYQIWKRKSANEHEVTTNMKATWKAVMLLALNATFFLDFIYVFLIPKLQSSPVYVNSVNVNFPLYGNDRTLLFRLARAVFPFC